MLTLETIRLTRGIYSRVARQLAVDPSYVSRVARGERKCVRIENALNAELKKLQKKVAASG